MSQSVAPAFKNIKKITQTCKSTGKIADLTH